MAFNFFKNDFGWVRGQSGNSKRLSETQGRRAPAKKVPPASLAEAMILDTEAAVMANFDFLAQVLSVFLKHFHFFLVLLHHVSLLLHNVIRSRLVHDAASELVDRDPRLGSRPTPLGPLGAPLGPFCYHFYSIELL